MAAADILDLPQFKIFTVDPLPRASVHHLAKFHQNQSNVRQRQGDLTVFLLAAVRHLGFGGRLLGPPTMTTWWSLSLCQIWLKSMQ